MNPIKMVDLQRQHSHIRSEITSRLESVVDSGAYINGPAVKEFASNLESFLGAQRVVPCGNGTDAIQIALLALGLQPGDEVIVPSFNYVAAAESIAILNMKPVFIDVDKDSFNLDPSLIEPAITNKTKAIMVVHLFGQSADMGQIMSIATKHNLLVIEDTAQSMGATYSLNGSIQQLGTIGDIGTTSFFPTKNLGCLGDGGAVYTSNAELGDQAYMVANHGQKVRYSFDCIGMNSRLDTLQATILDLKLQSLNACIEARRKNASKYDAALNHELLQSPALVEGAKHTYNQYTVQIRSGKRAQVQDHLKAQGIPSMIYYPIPLHMQKAYEYLGNGSGDFPVSEELCESVLSLPVHPEMEENQIDFVVNQVHEALNK